MKRFAFIFLFAAIVLVSGFIIASDVNNPGSGSGSTTIINNFINQGTQTYLVSGGEVSWLSNLVFRVNAAQYVIDGVTYNSTATNVTLSAADGTNPRVDVFTLNTSSVVEVEEGTPSVDPAKPTVPANQLEISFVQVNPGETTPAIVQTWIYRENTEWTVAGVGTTWVADSTNQAYNGTKSVSGASINAATEYATFTTSATDVSNVGLVQLSIWVDNAWAVGNYLRARFFNGTSAASGYVNLQSSYGMNYTTTGAWQVVTVPIGAFALNSTTVTQLRIEGFGSGNKNFYLDDINLQAGLPQVSAVATYKTVTGNAGSTTANSPSDVLNIRGNNGLLVQASNDRIDIYPPAAPFNPINQVQSGSVTWIASNEYAIGSHTYLIQGQSYTAGTSNIFLNTAINAPTNRIDWITATTGGIYQVVEGTAGTTALTPSTNPFAQVPISGAITITGGQTTPEGFSAELVYDENVGPAAEWTTSVTGSNVDADDTTSPYTGTKRIAWNGSNTYSGDYVTFSKASDKDLLGTYWLSFAVKLNEVAPGIAYISFSFWLDGGFISEQLINMETFGLNPNDTVNWQVLSIPLAALSPGRWIDQINMLTLDGFEIAVDKVRLVAGTMPTYPQAAFTKVETDNGEYSLDAFTPNSLMAIRGLNGITTSNNAEVVYIDGSALAGIQTAVSTNLAAGLPTVVGSQLLIGTNVTAGITLNGYESTIGPSDIFGWYSGGSIASSNNAAPVYWSSTDANGDYLGLGFTSSDSLLQSRYAFAVPKIPSYASGWNSGTGMVVSVYTSDTGTSSLLDFRITSPNGTQFSTNSLASSVANTLTHFYIPGSSLPGFSNNTATADWTIRFDFKCKSSATAAVSRVKFQFQ